MTEAAAILSLLRLPGIGAGNLRLILARLFQIGMPIERITGLTDQQLSLHLRLSPEQITALRNPASDAQVDLDHCAELGIGTLLPRQPQYPLRVLDLLGRTAPALLFAQGNLDLLSLPALGISGSRRSCEASLAALSQLCAGVASQGWVIVSGGAHGADETAHLAALREGPGTIIILPTGILKPNLRPEFRKRLEEGKTLLLSEFPPEQGWTVGCGMQRNRLLAALSWALTLVEPGRQGGTGGTGRIALKIGVPLFILQGGAGLGEGADDFLEQGAQRLEVGPHARPLTLQLLQSHREAEAKRATDRLLQLFTNNEKK
jgi:DNA processing protein